jgi:hypothetical protein
MEGNVARIGEMNSTHKVLVWKTEEKRPIWNFSHTWKGNGIKYEQLDDMNCIHLIQGKDHWRALVTTADVDFPGYLSEYSFVKRNLVH